MVYTSSNAFDFLLSFDEWFVEASVPHECFGFLYWHTDYDGRCRLMGLDKVEGG